MNYVSPINSNLFEITVNCHLSSDLPLGYKLPVYLKTTLAIIKQPFSNDKLILIILAHWDSALIQIGK